MEKDSTKLSLVQASLINDPEFLGMLLKKSLQQVLDKEFEDQIGAGRYERTDERRAYRNGNYTRQLTTRIGTIELSVPRDRDGMFQTELFERYQRSEKAFVAALAEMYVQGVSTRKVGGIVEQLCGHGISKSQVSELTKSLDVSLKAWRERILKKEYTYIIFDAIYEKVREGGHVISKANLVAVGIDSDGYREVIGCQTANSEHNTEWSDFFRKLKARDLRGVKLTISDDHSGLKKALEENFPGIPWQRCQVHFARNLIGKLNKKEQGIFLKLLKDVFEAPTKEMALNRSKGLSEALRRAKKDSVADWIEENVENTLSIFEFPEEYRKKIRTTNMLERLNQELRRRSRVVRIFPGIDSCERLLTAICQEISESWMGKKYLKIEILNAKVA